MPQEAINRLEASATLTDETVISCQTTQSLAMAMQVISVDEALLIFDTLGGDFPSAFHFNAKPLAARIVVISVCAQLMRAVEKVTNIAEEVATP